MKLLHVDSSARSLSVSRALTAKFVEAWKQEHPTGKVAYRDLAKAPLPPPISAEWSVAANSEQATLTPEQRQVLALSDELIAEVETADIIVLGAPMYNFAISAPLKAWIDHVVRQGRT